MTKLTKHENMIIRNAYAKSTIKFTMENWNTLSEVDKLNCLERCIMHLEGHNDE